MTININSLNKIDEYIWEIPKSFRADMQVPARIFASEKILKKALTDQSLEQLVNVATLPLIQKYALVMPDVHEGYGFPIGGVAAFSYPDGVISPGGIGYDINCGVRLLTSTLTSRQIKPHISKLANLLYNEIPSGVGVSGNLKITYNQLETLLIKGARFAVEGGYGEGRDLDFLESGGKLSNADPDKVSPHAKERGKNQLGTMGAGNHFVEVGEVEEIFDERTAQTFGLYKNQITVLIHCGSRGLGHQVATDYIRIMLKNLDKYKISLPDRELACAPFSSKEGSSYFSAMAAAANFAWANRQFITDEVRHVWKTVFGTSQHLNILYDVSHNIAKIEEHDLDGKITKLIVHRKGATRAFPPGHEELPTKYKEVGQPVMIPGSMGTSSFVLVGTPDAMRFSFGSSCHGAGRSMSRHQAKNQVNSDVLLKELEEKGITIKAGSLKGTAEEAPIAYKDIDEVIDVVVGAKIAQKVARIKPQVVVKG